jgi:hypothetical protein
LEVVFVERQNPLIPHPPQLGGKAAPFHREVVGQLLPGIGNVKFRIAAPLRLRRQIGSSFSRVVRCPMWVSFP